MTMDDDVVVELDRVLADFPKVGEPTLLQRARDEIVRLREALRQHDRSWEALTTWVDHKAGRAYRWNRELGHWEDDNG